MLHAKWLNTLSYLENCGARKIAACEHPTLVREEVLKHAAEEFRHAHYLKKQLQKLPYSYEDYALPTLLGGHASLRYLDRLDLAVTRFLGKTDREASYTLVTYAIEVRAEKIYPLYEEVLREKNIPIYVKSIVLEEEEHLNEMRAALIKYPPHYEEGVLNLEEILFQKWLGGLLLDISRNFPHHT